MAQVYSTRFIAGTGAGGSALTYLVPAGFRAVVKGIDSASFTNDTAIQVGLGATWFHAHTFTFTAPIANASDSWYGHQVINAGETLEVEASPGVTFLVSGYLLAAP